MHYRQAVFAFRRLEREAAVRIGVEVRIHERTRRTIDRRRIIDASDGYTGIRRHGAIAHVGNAVRRLAAGATGNMLGTVPEQKN